MATQPGNAGGEPLKCGQQSAMLSKTFLKEDDYDDEEQEDYLLNEMVEIQKLILRQNQLLLQQEKEQARYGRQQRGDRLSRSAVFAQPQAPGFVSAAQAAAQFRAHDFRHPDPPMPRDYLAHYQKMTNSFLCSEKPPVVRDSQQLPQLSPYLNHARIIQPKRLAPPIPRRHQIQYQKQINDLQQRLLTKSCFFPHQGLLED